MLVRHQSAVRRGIPAAALALLLCCLLLPPLAQSQTPQFSNTSTNNSNNIYPWGSSTTNNKVQSPYQPNEIVGAYPGNITKVYFRHWISATMIGATTYSDLTITMAQVAGTYSSTTTYYTPMTQVFYSASCLVPAGTAGSWFGFQLTTPYYYNPSMALIVTVCHSGYTGTGKQINASSMTVPPNRRLWATGCTATGGSTDGLSYDIGVDMAPSLPNDAGIMALTSPVNFCAAQYPLKVKMRNFGTNTINNVTINWTYDGAPQPPVPYSTPLPSLNETELTLGTFNYAPGVPHTLKAWTSQPNSVADSYPNNDTLNATMKPAISGNFTIGGASPNYLTFAAAVADLNAAGICGPVVFTVRSGTYNEQISLNNVQGVSSTNTITFQSETGNRADVVLTFAATTVGDPHTIRLNSTDYVTFKNMTILGTGATYAQTIVIMGGSDYNKFINNIIRSVNIASTSANYSCVYSASGLDNYNEFRNNLIEYGGYAFYWYGLNTTSGKVGTILDNNIIREFYYFGLAFYYQDAPQITRNTIQSSSGSTNYGAYLYYNYNNRLFDGNKVIFTGAGTKYAIYSYYNLGTPSAPGRYSNNFISVGPSSTAAYTMYMYYNDNQMVYNNSIYNGANAATYYAAYVYYGTNLKWLNNIIYSNNGYTYYVAPGTNIIQSDYNCLYTGGTNFAYWNAAAASLAALRTLSAKDANSISKPISFTNAPLGDLHLTGASQDDPALTGIPLPEITVDIDNEPRARPYIGADEGCYITPGSVTFDVTDAGGTPLSYFNYPGTVYVKYSIGFPVNGFTATITVNFYTIPAQTLAYTTSFPVTKLAGVTLNGVQAITIPSIPSGYYRVEGVYNTFNSCGFFTNYKPGDKSLLGLAQGQTPCVVWPGDANNDGVVDYGDRSALNKYIQGANLSPVWLNGPSRYRVDYPANPLAYYAWEAQASAPWNTPDGCYMDTDGSGAVNSFDYLAMKINWLKKHGAAPKQSPSLKAGTFDMSQNYPNPFNPTTSIGYSVPENSQVKLVVTDMLGREVATLVNGSIEAGVHTVSFDASTLNSGQYIATVNMQGESGLSFSKTIKMTLMK